MRGYGSWLPVLLGCLAKCRPGVSGNAGKGSYLAEADAAESGTGQTDIPGVSGNAGKGSYLAEADAMRGGEVMWRRVRGDGGHPWHILRRVEHLPTHGTSRCARANLADAFCSAKGRLRSEVEGSRCHFVRPNDVLPEKSSFEGDLSGRRPFRWRKVICQLKSGKSWVSAARYVLIRVSYGSPGLSRTEYLPKGLWYDKDPFPVPNGQGRNLRRLRSLRRLRYMRGTATAPCASGPAGYRADLRFLPLTHEVNWKYSILPPPFDQIIEK